MADKLTVQVRPAFVRDALDEKLQAEIGYRVRYLYKHCDFADRVEVAKGGVADERTGAPSAAMVNAAFAAELVNIVDAAVDAACSVIFEAFDLDSPTEGCE